MAPTTEKAQMKISQQKISAFMSQHPVKARNLGQVPRLSQQPQVEDPPSRKPNAYNCSRRIVFQNVCITYPQHLTITQRPGELRMKFGNRDVDEVVLTAGARDHDVIKENLPPQQAPPSPSAWPQSQSETVPMSRETNDETSHCAPAPTSALRIENQQQSIPQLAPQSHSHPGKGLTISHQTPVASAFDALFERSRSQTTTQQPSAQDSAHFRSIFVFPQSSQDNIRAVAPPLGKVDMSQQQSLVTDTYETEVTVDLSAQQSVKREAEFLDEGKGPQLPSSGQSTPAESESLPASKPAEGIKGLQLCHTTSPRALAGMHLGTKDWCPSTVQCSKQKHTVLKPVEITDSSSAEQPMSKRVKPCTSMVTAEAINPDIGSCKDCEATSPETARDTNDVAGISDSGRHSSAQKRRKTGGAASPTMGNSGAKRTGRSRRSSAVKSPALASASALPAAIPTGTWMAKWCPFAANTCEGNLMPEGRWGATLLAATSSKAIMIGGASREGPLSEVWQLDREEGEDGCGSVACRWNALQPLDTARVWHAAASVRAPDEEGGTQCMVLFGGEAEERPGGDMCSVGDALVSYGPHLDFGPLPLSGDGAEAAICRGGHSCTALPDGRLLIFGGIDKRGKHRNDCFLIDPERMMWLPLSGRLTKGSPPKPRAYHTATLVGDRVVIVGGVGSSCTWSCKEVFTLQLGCWQWREHTPDVDGAVPSPRYGHTAAVCGKHSVVVVGGGDAQEERFSADIAVLDMLTWQWHTPCLQDVSRRPQARCGHAMVSVPQDGDSKSNYVIVAGRAAGDALCNDGWQLTMWRA